MAVSVSPCGWAAVLAFGVAVILVGRTPLIADAWPGWWRWWLFVPAPAVVIVLSVATGRRLDGGRPR